VDDVQGDAEGAVPESGGEVTTVSARELAAATPQTRNRYVDLIRVVAIGVVVLGHWMMAVLGYADGKFTGKNLLEVDPHLQILTWVFQVMPLFFIVGGFSNAASWTSARERGESYADWLRARSSRLVRPALWFVAFWTLIPVAGVASGLLPSSVARVGGGEVALPLWFLGVYLLAVPAVPPLLAAHQRFGPWVLVPLAIGALAVDSLRFGLDVTEVGVVNFAFVWLTMLELGFLWRDGALRRRSWIPWAMMGIGLAGLALLVGFFDYPVSMIGLTHGVRSNTLPPSAALVSLGVWQCGAMLLAEDAANRWLSRARPWLGVVVANSVVMTTYLWNMSAVVLAAVLLFPTGVAPQPEPVSLAWWLLRPLWILACAICLVPFVLAFRWAERPVRLSGDGGTGGVAAAATLAGTAIAAAGFAILTTHAFPVPGEVVFMPAIGVACVFVAAALLRVDPIAPLHARAKAVPLPA
jgi:fucose 4-O-acetylase-like acetyltransferase